jgi:hypothetical protein
MPETAKKFRLTRSPDSYLDAPVSTKSTLRVPHCYENALRAKARHTSCRCDRFLPLCSRFGAEDPQGGSEDEVALKVEGVVNCTVHAEEALSGSS